MAAPSAATTPGRKFDSLKAMLLSLIVYLIIPVYSALSGSVTTPLTKIESHNWSLLWTWGLEYSSSSGWTNWIKVAFSGFEPFLLGGLRLLLAYGLILLVVLCYNSRSQAYSKVVAIWSSLLLLVTLCWYAYVLYFFHQIPMSYFVIPIDLAILVLIATFSLKGGKSLCPPTA